MLESTELGLLFLSVAGVAVILYGLSLLAEFIKQHSKRNILIGEVQNCAHEERRDEKDQLIQYFYKLNIRYEDGRNIKTVSLNDTTERSKGEKVKLIRDGRRVKLLKTTYPQPVSALIAILCGAGMIAFQYLQKGAGDRIASLDASIVLLLAAISIIFTYYSDYIRTKSASQTTGTIKDLLLYETEKNTHKRIMRAPDTFYPVIRYTEDGTDREFLSHYSTNSKNGFKIGQETTVYKSPETGEIIEKKPNTILLIIAVVLIFLAMSGFMSL